MTLRNLFDEGDMQRVEREESLTEQSPRQPLQEDRTPEENGILTENGPSEENPFELMLDGILEALKGRL